MAAVRQYDPKKVIITFGGAIMSGFADGTFLTVTRREDAWSLQIGTDGEGTRSKSNNRSGSFELVLMQSSSSNDVLSALAEADELTNAGVFPALVKDVNGSSLYSAETAWIVKIADSEFGRDAGPRTWKIETNELIVFVGGQKSA